MGERDVYAQAMREGHIHAWAGRWLEAVGVYERALGAMPGDPAARASLASALARAGRPHDALAHFEELSEASPSDSALKLRVAELRQRVGRMDDSDRAYLDVAAIYLVGGQLEKATAIWRRVIGLSGHRPATMRLVANAAAAAAAADVAAEAQALAEEAGTGATATTVAAAAVNREIGSVAALAAALREQGLLQATFVKPSDEGAGQQSGGAHYGVNLLADDALTSLARDPSDLAASRRLGLALVGAGSFEAGRRHLTATLDVAELRGDLGAAVEIVDDLLPAADDPTALQRRKIQLALLGGRVDVAAHAHLALAQYFAARGDAQTAAAECGQARTVAAVAPEIHAAAAEVLLTVRLTAEALEARRRAFQLAPRTPVYALSYAISAAHQNASSEVDIALDALTSAVSESEGFMDSGALSEIVERDLAGVQPLVRWCRGRARELLGDARALADFVAAAASPPPLGPRAAQHAAESALNDGDPATALNALQPWLRNDDLSPRAQRWRGEPEPDALHSLAELAIRAADAVGDVPAAIGALETLATLNPQDEVLGAILAERLTSAGRNAEAAGHLLRLAERERNAGRLDSAFQLCATAAELHPEHPTAALEAAELALVRGDRDEARRRFIALADVQPTPAVSALLRAAELSPASSRVDLLRRAVALSPDDAEPRRRLLAALVAIGQVSLAVAEAAELAERLERGGDRAGALAALDQARRLDPWNPGLAALHTVLSAREDSP